MKYLYWFWKRLDLTSDAEKIFGINLSVVAFVLSFSIFSHKKNHYNYHNVLLEYVHIVYNANIIFRNAKAYNKI